MPRLSQLCQSSAAVSVKAERKIAKKLNRMVPAYLSDVDNIRDWKVPFPEAIQDGKLWVIGSLGRVCSGAVSTPASFCDPQLTRPQEKSICSTYPSPLLSPFLPSPPLLPPKPQPH